MGNVGVLGGLAGEGGGGGGGGFHWGGGGGGGGGGEANSALSTKLAEMVDAFPSSLLIENKWQPAEAKHSFPTTLSSPNNGLNLGLGARLYNVTTTGPKVVGSPGKPWAMLPLRQPFHRQAWKRGCRRSRVQVT